MVDSACLTFVAAGERLVTEVADVSILDSVPFTGFILAMPELRSPAASRGTRD
jgi:hypothetical protein